VEHVPGYQNMCTDPLSVSRRKESATVMVPANLMRASIFLGIISFLFLDLSGLLGATDADRRRMPTFAALPIAHYYPNWLPGAMLIGVAVLWIPLFFIGTNRYPGQAGLADALAGWRERNPHFGYRWYDVELPDWDYRRRRRPPREACHFIRRYTVNRTLESWGHRGMELRARRAEVGGRIVTASGVTYHARRATAVAGSATTHSTAVSLELPTKRLSMAVYPLYGYRCWSVYKWVSFWRFRTGNKKFDREFFVYARRRGRARAALTDEMVRFLLTDFRAEYLYLIAHHGVLCATIENSSELGKEEINPAAEYLMAIYLRLPESVR
jgi:hypothetical protein